jgi:RES domain
VPKARPPLHYDGTPHRYLLRRGTFLRRVHPQAYRPFEFNRTLADELYGGARFDATTADPYPYLYVGQSEVTVLAETLLRDVAPGEDNYRIVPNDKALGRSVSQLMLTQDLALVSLIDGQDLGAIGQNGWLVDCSPHDYPWTRDWARWLRRQASWAHGFIWDSRYDRGGLAMVLFGDRLARDFGAAYEETLPREVVKLADDLGDPAGVKWVNERLRPYRAIVSPTAW